MTRYRIRITSGEYAGRYVGPSFGGGLMTDAELAASREVRIPDTSYSLFPEMRHATEYLPGGAEAVQAQLRDVGYDSEMVEVDALDFLPGLNLSVQNIEVRILRACQNKFKEQAAVSVHLYFGKDENHYEVTVDKDVTVEILKEALALARAKGYDHISRYES
jgi:hypothetical protein